MSETRKPLAETDDKFAELRRPLDEVEVRFIKELAALRGQIAELDRRAPTPRAYDNPWRIRQVSEAPILLRQLDQATHHYDELREDDWRCWREFARFCYDHCRHLMGDLKEVELLDSVGRYPLDLLPSRIEFKWLVDMQQRLRRTLLRQAERDRR